MLRIYKAPEVKKTSSVIRPAAISLNKEDKGSSTSSGQTLPLKPMSPENMTEQPIPKVIHLIWVGENIDGVKKHLRNISNTRKKNPNYGMTIHTLVNDNNGILPLTLTLAQDNVTIQDLNKEPWFKKYKNSEEYEQVKQSMMGERKNYASTFDIIRKRLIYELGGIYNDMDDIYTGSLPEIMTADANTILTTKGVTFERWGGDKGVHSSAFASNKNNELLKIIYEDSYQKFKENRSVIYQKNKITDDFDKNFKLNSSTAGSLHFSKFVMHQNNEFEKAYGLAEKEPDHPLVKKYMPFAGILKPVVTSGAGDFDNVQQLNLVEALAKKTGRIMI